jgi:chromosome segregation ATPase
MTDNQMGLLPMSDGELQDAAFRLAALIQEEADAEENFKETKDEHKEHVQALRRAIKELSRGIRAEMHRRGVRSSPVTQAVEQMRGTIQDLEEHGVVVELREGR